MVAENVAAAQRAKVSEVLVIWVGLGCWGSGEVEQGAPRCGEGVRGLGVARFAED